MGKEPVPETCLILAGMRLNADPIPSAAFTVPTPHAGSESTHTNAWWELSWRF